MNAMVSPTTGSRDGGASVRWLLVVCWLVWAGLLFGFFAIGEISASQEHRIPRAARMASSATLVIAAAIWVLGARRYGAELFAALVAVGMTLGFIGDLFNANLMPIPLPDPVLGGIAAFGLGHIFYIWACIEAARRAALPWNAARTWALAGWLLVAVVAWYFVVMLAPGASILKWPALPYSLLLAATTGMATGLALADRRFTWMAIGAALFLLSDLILAYRLFQGSFYLAGDVVWLTYGPGQMLIVFGAMLGCRSFVTARPTPEAAVSQPVEVIS